MAVAVAGIRGGIGDVTGLEALEMDHVQDADAATASWRQNNQGAAILGDTSALGA